MCSKKHHVTDQEGLVLGVLTTKASTNEIANLAAVLDTAYLPENIPLKADKGYPSAKNKELLKTRKLKNPILKKAKKGVPLRESEKRFNKLVGKTRFKVARTFGGIKSWCKGGIARYRRVNKKVPVGSVPAYEGADVWLDFGTTIAIVEEPNLNTESHIKENAFSIAINNDRLEITQEDRTLKINRVQIINLLGQVVKTSKENSIALSNLPAGVYIVSIATKNGRFSKKFVRE